MSRLLTNVYVDGFNFYYGCVKGTPYKWLSFRDLCNHLLDPAKNDLQTIKYFTARVDGRGDPDRPTRQDAYIRALRAADSRLEVVFGHFLTNPTTLPRADGKGYVRVLRTEEKGSDVNLATHLLHDAHMGAIGAAVLITNDSDLVEPVRIVRQELGIPVGIMFPVARKGRMPSTELAKEATFMRRIRSGVLKQCLLPDPVTSPSGNISKPASW